MPYTKMADARSKVNLQTTEILIDVYILNIASSYRNLDMSFPKTPVTDHASFSAVPL